MQFQCQSENWKQKLSISTALHNYKLKRLNPNENFCAKQTFCEIFANTHGDYSLDTLMRFSVR